MKKTYSIDWENDEVSSIEVNGVQYDNPEQILDLEDRSAILSLISNKNDEDFNREFDEFHQSVQQELDDSEKQPDSSSNLFVAIFLSSAVVMFGISAISSVIIGRTLAQEKSAPGRVVDLVAREDLFIRKDKAGRETRSWETYYYPVVEFKLPDDSHQTVELSVGSRPPSYTKGETVTILYNPGRPQRVRIDSVSNSILMWLLPMITGGLCVAFGGVSFIMIRIFPPSQNGKRLKF